MAGWNSAFVTFRLCDLRKVPVKWKDQCLQMQLVSPTLPGLAEVMVIHTWFTSRIFQRTLAGAPGLEFQADNGSKEMSAEVSKPLPVDCRDLCLPHTPGS